MKFIDKLSGKWYEILPFVREYKEPFDLVNQGLNSVFILTKDNYNTRIFMKAKNISTTLFQAKETELPKILYNNNFNLYLRSVHLMADEVHRDTLFQLFSDDTFQNTTVIVSSKKILRYLPLQLELRKVTDKKGYRIEGRKKELLSKNAEPLFLTEIFVSTDNEDNAHKIREVLPQDHMYFRIKTCSEKKIQKVLNWNLNSIVISNILGIIINSVGIPIALDTVLNKTELANLVSLPFNPSVYSLVPGESRNLSQGFNIEEE